MFYIFKGYYIERTPAAACRNESLHGRRTHVAVFLNSVKFGIKDAFELTRKLMRTFGNWTDSALQAQ